MHTPKGSRQGAKQALSGPACPGRDPLRRGIFRPLFLETLCGGVFFRQGSLFFIIKVEIADTRKSNLSQIHRCSQGATKLLASKNSGWTCFYFFWVLCLLPENPYCFKIVQVTNKQTHKHTNRQSTRLYRLRIENYTSGDDVKPGKLFLTDSPLNHNYYNSTIVH